MYIVTEREEDNPKHHNLTEAHKILNAWKSFMILWYCACQSSQPKDFFDAVKAAKWFEYSLKNTSLWQAIKFLWLVRKENYEQFK